MRSGKDKYLVLHCVDAFRTHKRPRGQICCGKTKERKWPGLSVITIVRYLRFISTQVRPDFIGAASLNHQRFSTNEQIPKIHNYTTFESKQNKTWIYLVSLINYIKKRVGIFIIFKNISQNIRP
jgi:hypothetical protein